MFECFNVCMFVFCMFECLYVCMFVCLYVCLYVWLYITNPQKNKPSQGGRDHNSIKKGHEAPRIPIKIAHE